MAGGARDLEEVILVLSKMDSGTGGKASIYGIVGGEELYTSIDARELDILFDLPYTSLQFTVASKSANRCIL